MTIKFNPTGYLNISTDPMDLPEEVSEKSVVSGAMTRCKNLDLGRPGIARTRKGSNLKSATVLTETINHLQVMDDDRYAFGGDQIFKNESSIVTGLSSAAWDSLVYLAYNETDQSIFATNGTDRKRIQGTTVAEWGIEAPVASPVVSGDLTFALTQEWEKTDLTAGNYGYKFTTDQDDGYVVCYTWEKDDLDGNASLYNEVNAVVTTMYSDYVENYADEDKYGVKITYARYDGDLLLCESNPSPEVYTNVKSGLIVTWAAPSDSQVTHIRVYRTLANFYDYYYAGEFEYDESYGVLFTPDESLGSLVAMDHDRPPAGSLVAGPDFNGVCFMAYNQSLYYSKPKQPEYWPALYNVECSIDQLPITGMAFLSGQLYVATAHEIYQVQGSGAESFFPLPMAAITGTRSSKVFLPVKGYGIFHLGYDGLYVYTSSTDIKISGKSFDPIFNNETKNGIPYINKNQLSKCILTRLENKLWFGYPGVSGTYCDNFLVIELESNMLQGITGKSSYYSYPMTISAMNVYEPTRELLAVGTDKYIYKLDVDNTTKDSSADIAWEIESKSFGAMRKYFPRWARYDVELNSGATAAGEIVLNDVVKQTHIITQSRKVIKRLIDGCTGDRISIRINGSGPVSIFGAEVE